MATSEQYFGEDDEGTQHPPEYRADLNPESMDLEQIAGTAADLKPINQELSDVPDDVLERVLIVRRGSRLKQGSTYLDLHAPHLGEFVATGDMRAGDDSQIVPKARCDYEAWNYLMQRFGIKERTT
jgi:hypothetical protein